MHWQPGARRDPGTGGVAEGSVCVLVRTGSDDDLQIHAPFTVPARLDDYDESRWWTMVASLGRSAQARKSYGGHPEPAWRRREPCGPCAPPGCGASRRLRFVRPDGFPTPNRHPCWQASGGIHIHIFSSHIRNILSRTPRCLEPSCTPNSPWSTEVVSPSGPALSQYGRGANRT